jgi:hypothetical protein
MMHHQFQFNNKTIPRMKNTGYDLGFLWFLKKEHGFLDYDKT